MTLRTMSSAQSCVFIVHGKPSLVRTIVRHTSTQVSTFDATYVWPHECGHAWVSSVVEPIPTQEFP